MRSIQNCPFRTTPPGEHDAGTAARLAGGGGILSLPQVLFRFQGMRPARRCGRFRANPAQPRIAFPHINDSTNNSSKNGPCVGVYNLYRLRLCRKPQAGASPIRIRKRASHKYTNTFCEKSYSHHYITQNAHIRGLPERWGVWRISHWDLKWEAEV